MSVSSSFHHLPFSRRPPVLDWRFPAMTLFMVLFLVGPVLCWSGLANPALLKFSLEPWPVLWAQVTASLCALALLIIPLCWVVASRVLDVFALILAQNALLIAGYFFLNTTAYHLYSFSAGILESASLVVLINTIGFAVLFGVMGTTYAISSAARARLAPLFALPEDYDRRLSWLLRISGILVTAVIALPMAASGTIPLLAEDPVEARFAMIHSDTARALYHAGTAILPFITGGLLMLIIRRPLRVFGIDGWIAGGIVVIQILTSNRLPMAITLFAMLTLFTVEKKLPRPLLLASFLAFLIFFTVLSGFTAILRQDRASLGQEGNVVTQSVQEAFLGDNLIDLRDAAWVLSQWDYEPLMGRTYLGGLVSLVPSGLFPLKKEWHLGLTGVRIVGWDPDQHFGLRITFFGESFLNFGIAGVIGLGIIMGALFGVLLRVLHLVSAKRPPCLHYSLKIVILMQMCLPLTNTSDAFTFWAMLAFLLLQWLTVDLPLLFQQSRNSEPSYAQGRT